jgi:hypothetical protein
LHLFLFYLKSTNIWPCKFYIGQTIFILLYEHAFLALIWKYTGNGKPRRMEMHWWKPPSKWNPFTFHLWHILYANTKRQKGLIWISNLALWGIRWRTSDVPNARTQLEIVITRVWLLERWKKREEKGAGGACANIRNNSPNPLYSKCEYSNSFFIKSI